MIFFVSFFSADILKVNSVLTLPEIAFIYLLFLRDTFFGCALCDMYLIFELWNDYAILFFLPLLLLLLRSQLSW